MMQLNKEIWMKEDIEKFQNYLESFRETDEKKIKWSRNLLNTALPTLTIKTPVMKEIEKEIYKGNYLSFLDLMIWEYYENTAINGMLICRIKDFDSMKKYLDRYSDLADNWATCDLLTFKIKNNEQKYMDLIHQYIKSTKPFKRRIGIKVLFEFVDDEKYLPTIFSILDTFKEEENYYVNMINAWLLSDCFAKHRDKTIAYFENNNLNKFTTNKAISKCRDSRRISKEDKEMLLKYRRKE
ncbi:MAG: DNA alkylation repair protein [Bacilli bacterium]|nr:DNA alkylation repair protein [Bacilli bacterium]